MKWALISVLLSGIWDSGLRYDNYKDCFAGGVQASFLETLGANKQFLVLNGKHYKTFAERDIANAIEYKRQNHERTTLCVPTK